MLTYIMYAYTSEGVSRVESVDTYSAPKVALVSRKEERRREILSILLSLPFFPFILFPLFLGSFPRLLICAYS